MTTWVIVVMRFKLVKYFWFRHFLSLQVTLTIAIDHADALQGFSRGM
jgi:hypothetical protein